MDAIQAASCPDYKAEFIWLCDVCKTLSLLAVSHTMQHLRIWLLCALRGNNFV